MQPNKRKLLSLNKAKQKEQIKLKPIYNMQSITVCTDSDGYLWLRFTFSYFLLFKDQEDLALDIVSCDYKFSNENKRGEKPNIVRIYKRKQTNRNKK